MHYLCSHTCDKEFRRALYFSSSHPCHDLLATRLLFGRCAHRTSRVLIDSRDPVGAIVKDRSSKRDLAPVHLRAPSILAGPPAYRQLRPPIISQSDFHPFNHPAPLISCHRCRAVINNRDSGGSRIPVPETDTSCPRRMNGWGG